MQIRRKTMKNSTTQIESEIIKYPVRKNLMKELQAPPLHKNPENSAGDRRAPGRSEALSGLGAARKAPSVRATCGSAGPTLSSLSQQVLRAPSPASSKACAFSKNGAGRRAPSGSRPCHEAAGTKRVSRGRSGARGRARLGLGQGFGRSGPAGAAASAAFPQTALGGSGMEDKRGVLAAAAEASGEARKPDASDCERPTGAPSA